jgi:hypothetical protein
MEPEQVRINIIPLVGRLRQTWPAVNEQERDGVFVVRFFVHEMDSLVPNGGRVLC